MYVYVCIYVNVCHVCQTQDRGCGPSVTHKEEGVANVSITYKEGGMSVTKKGCGFDVFYVKPKEGAVALVHVKLERRCGFSVFHS